jgi:hypothetical protein
MNENIRFVIHIYKGEEMEEELFINDAVSVYSFPMTSAFKQR